MPLVKMSRLNSYLKDIQKYPLLSAEEERELAKRARSGDEAAKQKLVNCNLRFVVSVARRYAQFGIEIEDLVQEGNQGLMKAVEAFNPERNVRLCSYAVWKIKVCMRNYIMKTWSSVKQDTTQAKRSNFFKAKNYFYNGPLVPPSINKFQEREWFMSTAPQINARHEKRWPRDLSLNTTGIGSPVYEFRSLLDGLPNHKFSPILNLLRNEEIENSRKLLARALMSLSKRERYIIMRRVVNDKPLTLKTLGEIFSVSREWVRLLEKSALKKIKKILAENGITYWPYEIR